MFNIKKKSNRGIVIQTSVPKEVYEHLQKVVKESGLHMSSLLRLIIMQHFSSPKLEANEGNL